MGRGAFFRAYLIVELLGHSDDARLRLLPREGMGRGVERREQGGAGPDWQAGLGWAGLGWCDWLGWAVTGGSSPSASTMRLTRAVEAAVSLAGRGRGVNSWGREGLGSVSGSISVSVSGSGSGSGSGWSWSWGWG